VSIIIAGTTNTAANTAAGGSGNALKNWTSLVSGRVTGGGAVTGFCELISMLDAAPVAGAASAVLTPADNSAAHATAITDRIGRTSTST